MQRVQLGKTDLIVSRICFGCWQLSPRFWGDISQEEWWKAARTAVDRGINFIDTANAYGDGLAESVLGEFLEKEGLRDETVVATKFYWNIEAEERHPDTRYEYILSECEASLKRLKTDRIDLYQMHSWDPLTRPDEVAAAIGRLKKEGKIRWFGVSNLNPEQMRMYSNHLDIETLQPPYSLLNREIERHELPHCLGKRIGTLVFSPLFRGLLSGKYGKDDTFDDFRKSDPLFHGPGFHRILEGINELQPIAERHGLSIAQLAIRWVLTHPAVTCAILGVKKPEHIETILPAAEDALPHADWHAAAGIMNKALREARAAAT